MTEIKVCLFARLREELGEGTVTLTPPAVPCTVDDVIAGLAALYGSAWAQALHDDNLVVALNQTVCSRDTLVRPGDELAIFPPVTGG